MRPYAEFDLVSYAHCQDPMGTRYIDLATSVIPVWAVDVQPFEYPELPDQPDGYIIEIFLEDEE